MEDIKFTGSIKGKLVLSNLTVPFHASQEGVLTLELSSSEAVWDFISLLKDLMPAVGRRPEILTVEALPAPLKEDPQEGATAKAPRKEAAVAKGRGGRRRKVG